MPTLAQPEFERLREDASREKNWTRWGPYLPERQWGTVREDYSENGTCWEYFPHDHARSRTYRWGEDGLLGICDREQRLCFAFAFWNGADPILKERLFGLTNGEGNHGEDVKESYFYLDATPTFSWFKGLYKYPQTEFPYASLLEENRRRGNNEPEFELIDTGIFDNNQYFDIFSEYAKVSPDHLVIRLTVHNRSNQSAVLHVLPTLWFRNTWSWGRTGEGYWPKGSIRSLDADTLVAQHSSLGSIRFQREAAGSDHFKNWLFTENETNAERMWGIKNSAPYVKDSFHQFLIEGNREAVHPEAGTKAAGHFMLEVPAHGEQAFEFRLFLENETNDTVEPGAVLHQRAAEADDFYSSLASSKVSANLTEEETRVIRQAFAGLLWSRQFYFYSVDTWLAGDPLQPEPPASRLTGRNSGWTQLYNRDVLSMPDKWEYPWYAAWDLAFHTIMFAAIDPNFAKQQLLLIMREWYMHPSGQFPAYEFAFNDVNPPVHAWACWRVYKMTGPRGARDTAFLQRAFHKLLLNFTWWVNRKDIGGKHIFAGGFLGLDNIGPFDRSKPLPGGGVLEQADGTAWMAFYCTTMLGIAIDLSQEEPAYQDVASKFFEHFVSIADAINTLGGSGLWDEQDGFYYDQLMMGGKSTPLRVRSLVGLIPLLAVEVLENEEIGRLTGFRSRLNWFVENRADLARHVSYMETADQQQRRLLAIPSRERLQRLLSYMLDENEFLSSYGIRSLSKYHLDHPFEFRADGNKYEVQYVPGESNTYLFGGNSNWRGPIWLPINYLIIEALERYHHFYGDTFKVECPTGSGRMMNLQDVAHELSARLARLFLPGADGRRPLHGQDLRFAQDPNWKDLVLYYEYFHGEDGRGLGASHQTGWTSLVARCIRDVARSRSAK